MTFLLISLVAGVIFLLFGHVAVGICMLFCAVGAVVGLPMGWVRGYNDSQMQMRKALEVYRAKYEAMEQRLDAHPDIKAEVERLDALLHASDK